MPPKWKSKFELKPGKWVFEPTDESILIGNQIKSAIEKVWTPPEYYFHLRSGGHVAAVRSHLDSKYFLRVDIQNFFGSINRSRVTRCLNKFFNYPKSRDWASASTVAAPTGQKRSILPFGFVQSQIISAVCLSQSTLGKCVNDLNAEAGVNVSVYVDDIIISSEEIATCSAALEKIQSAAHRSKFLLNEEKLEGPAESITAFNISLSSRNMEIIDARLSEFKKTVATSLSESEIAGVISYVMSINTKQAQDLKLLLADTASAQLQHPLKSALQAAIYQPQPPE